MKDEHALFQRAQDFASRIANSAKSLQNILLIYRYSADGICAAALTSQFILKNNGHCDARALSEPNIRSLEKIGRENFDLVLFLDFGSNSVPDIAKYLGDKWLVIDHNYVSKEEFNSPDSDSSVLNPWLFEIDGSKEVSSAGMAYFLTERGRTDVSSVIAIVGALGDGQDIGPRRTLVGLNSKIVEVAKSSASLNDSRVDLLLQGRNTRPIHEALASTVSCFLPGLTGNKDACLASLRGAGIDLKLGSRWKTVQDLSEEEKQQVLAAVMPHLSGTTVAVEDLVGTVYCMDSVDEYSAMHDARDFASLLSACGRMRKSSIGLSLCVHADPELTNEAERTFSDYRTDLVRIVQVLTASAERAIERSHYSIILGDGILEERMTGAVCQVLATLNRSKNRIVFLRTTTQDGEVKVSARLGKGAEADLTSIMRSVAKTTSGTGGGFSNKAGAKFAIAKQQEFQTAVEAQFQSPRAK
jgi:single-stranded-DNA-specific exonuclease